jgi:hypothetical protein
MTASTARQTFREAVAQIAQKAKEKLPECNGRVAKAVKLVLAGDVAVLDEGRAVVASMSDATKTYAVEHSVCTCPDFPRAPHGFCAHRLAVAMARRVREVMPAPAEASSPTPAAPLPEAPASVNVRLTIGGREVQWTLRDTHEGRLAERLTALLARYPVPQAPASQGQASRPYSADIGWCQQHGVEMILNTKDGRQWWSHYDQAAVCLCARQ